VAAVAHEKGRGRRRADLGLVSCDGLGGLKRSQEIGDGRKGKRGGDRARSGWRV